MKLLSLAIASYNMEVYIDKCLETVTGPDIPDTLEVLVVNDGSNDRTSSIAHTYEKMFPNIVRVIDKSNGHYGSCINEAFKQAKGKYFRPLDADDWVDTKELIKLLNLLEDCEAQLVVTEFTIYKKSGTTTLSLPSHIEEKKIYYAKEFDVDRNQCAGLFAMHGMTFRTDILKDINLCLHTGIHYTDTEYILLPIDHIDTLVFFKTNLYQYNMMREGQSIQKSIQHQAVNSFYILSKYLIEKYIERADINNSIVKSNQRCILRRVLYYFLVAAIVFDNGKNENIKEQLSEIFKLLDLNKELKADAISFRFKGIHFVKFWNNYHIRIFSFIPKCIL